MLLSVIRLHFLVVKERLNRGQHPILVPHFFRMNKQNEERVNKGVYLSFMFLRVNCHVPLKCPFKVYRPVVFGSECQQEVRILSSFTL